MKTFLTTLVSRLIPPRPSALEANHLPDCVDDSQLSLVEPTRSRKSRDLTQYEVNTEIWGVVSGIEDYGLFMRLPNGESGLVFVNEINWPGEDIKYRSGDKVKVSIIGFKAGRGLALSIRQSRIQRNFDRFFAQHCIGAIIQGHIKIVLDYGIFVVLAPGVVGLLHVSAIPNIQDYGKSSSGDPIEVRVAAMEHLTNRISLEMT